MVVERLKRGEVEMVKCVRIFSNCRSVLELLQNNSITYLGSAIGVRWALEDVYNYTDLLVNRGVAAQLVWQKGHALSEGN
jgi:hypothetical protein